MQELRRQPGPGCSGSKSSRVNASRLRIPAHILTKIIQPTILLSALQQMLSVHPPPKQLKDKMKEKEER